MDECGVIPLLGYGEFSDWLHRKVGDQRIPISGSLELTMRCNLRCQHCYLPTELRAKRLPTELSLMQVQHILDDVTDAGCLWFLLTGGEPLLRKDFIEIYSYAKHKGLIVTVFTNGTLITPKLADYLAEWRPFSIEITLYGATQETYEKVTGILGSYSRCRQGIDLLLERNLPLSLKTMVMTLNYHELEQMKSLASSFGVKFRTDAIVNPRLNHDSQPSAYRITAEKVVALDQADPQRVAAWKKEFEKKNAFSTSDRRLYHCNAGRQGFHIDASGYLSQCLMARKPNYDLLTGSFIEGWNKFLLQSIDQEYPGDFECKGCELRPVCVQCPALAEIELGSNDKRVEFLCQVTKLRQAMIYSE